MTPAREIRGIYDSYGHCVRCKQPFARLPFLCCGEGDKVKNLCGACMSDYGYCKHPRHWWARLYSFMWSFWG